jgi:hypothetical protein
MARVIFEGSHQILIEDLMGLMAVLMRNLMDLLFEEPMACSVMSSYIAYCHEQPNTLVKLHTCKKLLQNRAYINQILECVWTRRWAHCAFEVRFQHV